MLLRQLYTSIIRIRRFCVWIFFFPLKCSSSSYSRVCVSYVALSVLQWVFTIRLRLILPQNIQISGQYLKFDEIYASANTCGCSRFRNFLIRKRALDLLIALSQIFCICRLKLIFLPSVIPSSSTIPDDLMVFPSKDLFFSMFVYFQRTIS